MNKQLFINRLQKGIAGLPQDDIEERLSFYSEMIDDRMEEGLSEEAAVNDIGDPDEVIQQIIAETPLTKIVKERISPKRNLSAWETVLLILGSPVWLPLLIAVSAVILSLYAVIWAVLVSLWAVFASCVLSSFSGAACGILFAVRGSTPSGLAAAGAGIICAGLAILMFFACRASSKVMIRLTGKITLAIKNCFIKKEET